MEDFNNLKHVAAKGQGYFCLVKQYTDEITGKNYALKELKKSHYSNEEYRYRLTREIKLLDELQGCKNIIRLINHGNDKENKKLWYLMPYAKYNLYDFVKKNNSVLTQEIRFNIASQVINAIKYAHERDILHRDISPNNALVFFKDGIPIIKVCDFGLGKDTEALSYYTASSASGYGQVLYVSPEQRIKLKDSTIKSDIYSLGRLIYFIFTGKDPDNLKPFELSTLVIKATEDNPEDRFADILEFETHFNALKDLQLNQTIPIEHITLKEVLVLGEKIDTLQFHQLLVKGNYIDHVYDDYISPINNYFLQGNNLADYYKSIGNGIRDFLKTYTNSLNECYQTVGWPFSSMNTFGKVLKKIIQIVSDDESRLLCHKQLWYLAFEIDQWSVQKDIKEVFTDNFITKNIETQLAEYIISAETKVDMKHFSNLIFPKVIKVAIIKANHLADKKAEERKRKEIDDDTEW
ncbi:MULTISPECIES: serine/threonine-protein kinase [unclassified Arcicella]|uniref:serine/threonine-protein kinase n=1 Tax=unclassified Arcicella TaxID=2644986 RepID=UPI00285F2718|nr:MULTISPECIES: serine/threonine-protein kinase [unclassified Arcicella]MDR6561899.1 serine/threonine protein kinase [Arcicella sp. BE51]MDR6814045.1 serine/threonine protein kinase [Arcicella sp. BE140]MDR6825248.1 serine/threonine protein kinase [Arcicella sp. BE139]